MKADWTADDMLKLGTAHAALEARCDLDGVMGTLVDDPVYEFWPAGLRMSGGAQVRRYYEHLFSRFIPMTRSYELIGEWVNQTAVAQEYEIRLEIDGAVEKHRVVGILFASGSRLGGERVYAGERCTRLMAGDLIDELASI